MATNTGIEVTALRPAAQAGDFYVRPEQYNSGVQQGLARLAGTMQKKQTVEDKARAEELYISDSFKGAEDLHNFEAYTQESPAVIANLKELRGRSYANQWRTKVEGEYNEWRMNSNETGMDFHEFMAERKTELADTLQGDRFMTSGAMGIINEAEHNMRSAHRSFLDQRTRVEVQEQMGENVSAYMSSMKVGDLNIGDAAKQVDDMVQLAHDTGGLHRSEGNKQMFEYAVAKYKATGDYDFMLLAQNLKFAKGAKGHVNAKAQLVLDQARDQVEAESYQRSQREAARNASALKTETQQAWNVVNMKLIKDANAELAPEDILSLTTRGVKMSTIMSVRTAFQNAGDIAVTDQHTKYKGAVLSAIKASAYNPRGNEVTYSQINEMVEQDLIHPDDMATLVGALDTAEKVNPILNDSLIKSFKTTMVDELKNRFNYKSEANAKRVGKLERDYDMALTRIVQTHFNSGGGKPSPNELQQFASQAEMQIKDSAQAMLSEGKEHDAYISKLTEAAKASEGTTEWHSDTAEIDNVNAIFTTPEGAELLSKLKEDPMILEDLDGVPTPVWKILDIMVDNAGDKGGFHVWYSANKAHFGG